MASKLMRAITALSLALTFYFVSAPAPVQAESSILQSAIQLHMLRFYLDPALVPDIAFAKSVLPKYVADMNLILAKNTTRQLVFDPESDIVITDTKPESGSAAPPLPTEGFPIWVHAVQTTSSLSYGGYASLDTSGAGVVDGVHWTRLYDPDQLATADVFDYTKQIGTILHEIAHIFGAGIGEYYSLASVADPTGADPLLNIHVSNAADPYWSDKRDFMADPLLRQIQAATRSDYLAAVRYSGLTAAVLNGDYRNGIPSFGSFTIQVSDGQGQPVPGAEVKVWNVPAESSYSSQLLYDLPSDENGQVSVAWGGTGNSHTATNLLRLIKVYRDGLPVTQPRYVSIFDADIALLVNGQSSFLVTPQPANQPPSDVTLSNAVLDENQAAGTLVGELTALDPDAGETFKFRFCGGPDDDSFKLDGGQLLSAAPLDYERQSSYSVCLQADDGRGGTLDKPMTIQVNDLPDTVAASFTSMGTNDGWVLESAEGSNKGGSLNAGGTSFRVGNDANNRRYRSVLAFNTSSLPDGALVTKVTLKVAQRAISHANPFELLGELVVDMGRPLIGTRGALQPGDFQAQAGMASAGAFVHQTDPEGWYSVELNSSAYGLVNPKGATQLRLEFSGVANTGAAYLALYSGNAALADRPVLIVEYELP